MELRPAPACGIMMRALRFPDAAALARALADALVEAATRPMPGPRAIMLAGGSTPLAAYRLLAERKPAWPPDARVFFSDERLVPPDDPRSNYGNIAPLIRESGLSDDRIERVRGEWPLDRATADYAERLDRLTAFAALPLGLLGLGADGHTASLFSEDDIRRGGERSAVAVRRPDGLAGISATPRVLRSLARIVIAVAGAEKRAIAERLVKTPRSIAAGLALQGHRGVEVWCDAGAWPFTQT
jgi:6-phosphogluconolactonase